MNDTAAASILVVDDNEDNRYTLVERLKRLGYSGIETAENGRQALEMLAERNFDAILLDVMMPGINGYEVLERLRSDAKMGDVPVIMISAVDQLESVVRCIELGAEDYLFKPFNAVLLKARLGACLEKKRLRDREREHLKEIERQRRKADDLLHVILPAQAVQELKARDRVEPKRHDNVAVLFCDIVDFSPYCDDHDPEEVVANLQRLVEAFETVAELHNMEKIKTVGDAFLATAGLLRANDDPVYSCVRSAFRMIDAARRLPAAWEVRVGIHSGAVVAGVVGHKTFSFDLWGDTVNLAQRLSTHGEPGSVNLSATAWRAVAERCSGHALGRIPLKGLGEVELFQCTAAQSNVSEGAA